MTDTCSIIACTLDESSLIRSDQFKDERERAVTDLLKQNTFSLNTAKGPYALAISLAESRIVIEVSNDSDEPLETISLSMSSLRRIMKDYAIICESYFEAIRFADPQKVEAIDMGRRSAHNDGAQLLREHLEANAETDLETARALFSIFYLLCRK